MEANAGMASEAEDAEALAALQQEIVTLKQQLGVKETEASAIAGQNGIAPAPRPAPTVGGAAAAASGGAALLPRRMEWERKRASPAISQPSELSILQFNVLADGLCGLSPTLGDFSRPPKDVLGWEYRGPMILDEMLRHDADIITAQEVDHFEDTFAAPMSRAGYSGLFQKKPCSPCLSFCSLEDGCAFWYKTSRVQLVSYEAFQYADRRKEEDEILNQGAQIAVLRLIATGQLVIVANTHLKASKTAKGEVVRAMEAQQLFDTVASVKAHAERSHSVSAIPYIIAGDFNATPTEDEGGDLCYKACLAHPLGARSAYPTTLEKPELFTTWKIRGKGGIRSADTLPVGSPGSSPPTVEESDKCNYIDYIFYGGGLAAPVGRLSIPDGDAIGTDRLPSATWPSDHLSILAVFEM